MTSPTRQTAAAYLEQLVEKGFLEKHKSGRSNDDINTPLVTLFLRVSEGPLFSPVTERVGFEPTVPCGTLVFKTRAINHSTTSPDAGWARPQPVSCCHGPA
jgi:hypothetical protein